MSTKTPLTGANSAAAKAVGKKKAKKASKGISNNDQSAPAGAGVFDADGGIVYDTGVDDTVPQDPTNLFNFAPGAYPAAEFSYEREFYDDANLPPSTTSPFSLPFPFDYSGLGQQANGTSLSSGFNITNEDLVQTASELYRRMADPSFGSDDAYWSSLPPHLRQFIREAIPFSGTQPAGQKGAMNEGQQGMWTMAQQIVSAASQGMGLGPGAGANLFRGVNGKGYNNHVAQELGFHRHPDAGEVEFDDEDEFDLDEGYAAPNGEVAKSKKKKNKKKKAGSIEPLPPTPPVAAVKQPPRQPIPPQPQPQPQPTAQPHLNPPPPPSTPAPTNPPPSSRAAGKQPMSANAPARSARAAGKAPAAAAPAHNHTHNHSHQPAKPAAKGKAPAPGPPAKIWTQASMEDRENIRQFWLTLNEAERRDLLLIEKDTVLRKMKEQHRHMCACAVCGRKKVNIESELDQLYEQYYDELSQYAMEQRAAANGRRPDPPGAGPFPGSVEVDATGQITKPDHRAPDPKALAPDIIDDASDEYDDDEYDDDDELDDEDGISDPDAEVMEDIPPEAQPPRQPKPPPKAIAPAADNTNDFLSYGTALSTIKGILTVADDLLRNDGGKFAEMMEQLAVARSAEVKDSEDEEPFTEAERVEEGKRMFQIFAARMFEQRVLQAYRERMAKQREEQLLRELEEEDDAKRAKEEKKAKESQKKKDKKKLQKQRADEEKAAKDAAVAAEQEAIKAKAAESERERLRKLEDERARREAVKKAAQEEQLRIANERRKRQQEEKDREEEAAKKKREREDKAKREREVREKEIKDKERRDKEEKAAQEKAEQERKAEKERVAKEAREKAQREAREKEEQRLAAERAEKVRQDEAAEQAKLQAQQERARLEQVAAEKAAAERSAAAAAIQPRQPPPVAPVPVRAHTASREMSPHTTPPMDFSPVKPPSASGSRAPARPATQQKPSYLPAPVGPVGAGAAGSYPGRMPPNLGTTAYRQFPGASPAFSPPTNGPSMSISPNPPRGSIDPSPYDLTPRTAPVGMGYPGKTNRIPSIDEAFSPPGFGSQPSSRHVSGETSQPAPIAPPPGPIGRPSSYIDPSISSASTSAKLSPTGPERQLGSAALGGDDEIVVPSSRRNLSNGWGGDIPIAAAPGSGRWSSAPGTGASIWGAGGDAAGSSTWGSNSLLGTTTTGVGAPRQTSFNQAIGSPFASTAQDGPIGQSAGQLPGGGHGPQHQSPFGTAGMGVPQGSHVFAAPGQGMFSPPGLAGSLHGQHHHYHQQHH